MTRIIVMLMVAMILQLPGLSQNEQVIRTDTLAGQVIVKLHKEATLQDAFDFINHYQLEVNSITGFSYDLGPGGRKLASKVHEIEERRSYVVKRKGAPFTKISRSGRVILIPELLNMHNQEFQDNWNALLERHTKWRLITGGIKILLQVDEGDEAYWIDRFSSQNIVVSASPNVRKYRKHRIDSDSRNVPYTPR